MIGYYHTVVCPSVRPSVTLCNCGAQVGVGGWKLYHRVPRTALPIHFFTHFCCWMYRPATTHSKKTNRRNFRVQNSHGQRRNVTVAIRDAVFSAFRSATIYRTPYAVRSAFLATATLLILATCHKLFVPGSFSQGASFTQCCMLYVFEVLCQLFATLREKNRTWSSIQKRNHLTPPAIYEFIAVTSFITVTLYV